MQSRQQRSDVEFRPVRVIERTPFLTSSVAEVLAERPPWLTLELVQDPKLAAVRVELSGVFTHGSLAFLGQVEGLLVEPFVHTLRSLSTGRVEWSNDGTEDELCELEVVQLEVFVSPVCPYSATVAETALRFAAASRRVSTLIRRADLEALPPGVHRVPTVLADGTIVAEGAMNEYQLVRQLAVYQGSMPAHSGVASVPPGQRGQPEPSRRPGPVSTATPASRRRRGPTAA